MAIGAPAFPMLSTPDVIEIPLDISQDNEIQQAIVVEIHPGRAGGPSATSHAGLRRNVGECSVAVVVIELIAAIGGDEEVFVAVIVKIAHRNAHTVAHTRKACFLRYVFEGAVI